ncbi:MAG: VanZ family protein [Nitrospirae bacterium]|nr:VanZ family protein [Nitrospirota bacterium]
MKHDDPFDSLLGAPPPADPMAAPASEAEVRFVRRLLWAWLGLTVYGTLYPWTGPAIPDGSVGALLVASLGRRQSASDVLFNLLVYIPLGLLLMRALGSPRPGGGQLAAVTLIGGALSLSLECGQAFVPPRAPSMVDVFTNTAGTLLGGLLGMTRALPGEWRARAARWRQSHLLPGALPLFGALVLTLWAVAQLSPFVPAPSVSHIRHGLAPLWHTLAGDQPFSVTRWLEYGGAVLALAVVGRRMLRPEVPAWRLYAVLGLVLLYKVPVVDRQLTLEAALGWLAGVALAHLAGRRRWPAACALLVSVAADRLSTGDDALLRPMDWVPFHGQMATLSGIADVADAVWPYAALAFLAAGAGRAASRGRIAAGALAVFGLAFALELLQQGIPGRYPDITDPIVALAAWLLPWCHPALRAPAPPDPLAPEPDALPAGRPRHPTR